MVQYSSIFCSHHGVCEQEVEEVPTTGLEEVMRTGSNGGEGGGVRGSAFFMNERLNGWACDQELEEVPTMECGNKK